MQRILIFGGSFNPPTLAHEAIIQACLAMPQFDEVWVMPSGSRSDKHIPTSDEHRMEMLRAMRHGSFADDPRLVVSDFELRLLRPSETYRTVPALSQAYPNVEFWFVFGGDAYRSMSTWPRADDFMHDMRMVVCTEEPIAANERVLQMHLPAAFQDMSSTQVRNTLASGGDASAWVSPAVLDYIAQHHLYR